MTVREAIGEVFAYFKAAYPNIVIHTNTMQIWTEMLKEFPPPQILRAGYDALKYSNYPSLPPIGQIREFCERATGKRISQFETLSLAKERLKVIDNSSAWESLVWHRGTLDKTIEDALRQAVDRFGWRPLLEIKSMRDQERFERIYEDIVQERRFLQTALALPPKQLEEGANEES